MPAASMKLAAATRRRSTPISAAATGSIGSRPPAQAPGLLCRMPPITSAASSNAAPVTPIAAGVIVAVKWLPRSSGSGSLHTGGSQRRPWPCASRTASERNSAAPTLAISTCCRAGASAAGTPPAPWFPPAHRADQMHTSSPRKAAGRACHPASSPTATPKAVAACAQQRKFPKDQHDTANHP